jgi:hypothetical protein
VGASTGAAFARGAEVPRLRSRADYDGSAATLVSRGFSPGESGLTCLTAAAAPTRTTCAGAGVRPGHRRGAWAVRVGGITEQCLTAPPRRRLDTRLLESAT